MGKYLARCVQVAGYLTPKMGGGLESKSSLLSVGS